MRCTLALRDGDLDSGLTLLQHRLDQSDLRAVERFLFRTGSRPRDFSQCMRVFARIICSDQVAYTHRCYALIAGSYLVLRHADLKMASELEVRIKEAIHCLREHPDLYGCPQGNRFNITKLYISLLTANYHLCLLLSDFSGVAIVWRQAIDFSTQINPVRLNADAGLRMTSNLCRCLALGAMVERDSDHDLCLPRPVDALNLQYIRLQASLPDSKERDRSSPQENHLGLLLALQQSCQDLHSVDPMVRERSRFAFGRLINHASNSSLTATIVNRLEQLDLLHLHHDIDSRDFGA
jgi:hypothetical protein